MGLIDKALKGAQDQLKNSVTRKTKFDELGVSVRDDGQVYDPVGKLLGPLAGAEAELTDTVKKHRIGSAAVVGVATLGAGAVLGLTSKKSAFAYVTFADGTFVEQKVKGKSDIQAAQREVAKFNAMARGASS